MDLVDILLEVLERDASDLHLSVGAPPIVRVNGVLERLDYPRLGANDTRELIYSILSQDQRQRLENEWEMDFSYSVPSRARFRVNAYFQRNSLGAAFRLIPVQIKKLEELGLPKALHKLTTKPRGFVVVTGPTGCGKSTTLAAMIDEINEVREEHIMTIEDPIEFLHRHKKCMINQREVGADTKSFNRALKSRAAPGPRRHPGRRDARHRDHGDRPHRGRDRATSSLPPCTPRTRRRPSTASSTSSRRTSRSRSACSSRRPWWGCARSSSCRRSDGRGRVVACELLIPTPAVRNLIREGKTHQIYSVMQTGTAVRHGDDGRRAGRPRAPRHHLASSSPSGVRARPTSSIACSAPPGQAVQRRAKGLPEHDENSLDKGRRQPGRSATLVPAPPRSDGGLMATFTYKALDARGSTASGQIDGDNKSAVAASLRNKGLTRRRHQRGQDGPRPDRHLRRACSASRPRTSPSSRASSRP